jgi:uncharacterized protein (DUF952 family)
MKNLLYHITSVGEAATAGRTGTYTPTTFGLDGFVHCSHPHQVIATANRIFRGRSDLVLLEIDSTQLQCPVVDENLEGGAELFPHVYGPLPMAAVVQVHVLACDESGRFLLPSISTIHSGSAKAGHHD